MARVYEAKTKESYLVLGSDVCTERLGRIEMDDKYFYG